MANQDIVKQIELVMENLSMSDGEKLEKLNGLFPDLLVEFKYLLFDGEASSRELEKASDEIDSLGKENRMLRGELR